MGRVGLVAWGCTAVLILAGCSTDRSSADDAPGAGSSTPADASPGAAADGAASDEDTTEPGSVLDLEDTATVAWRPSADLAGVLELSVDAVQEADTADFDGLVAPGAVEGARPYYVEVRVANAGDTDLGGLDVPLYLLDTSDTLGPPWAFTQPFRPCRSRPLPASFAPGDTHSACLVFFARAGSTYEAMVFQPTPDREAITWAGGAAAPPEGRRDRPSRQGR
ncbi:hypothetical protein [Nocardioides sp. P5_C9_2]